MPDSFKRTLIKPEEIGSLPSQAGCYLFKEIQEDDNSEKVLYVGKAKNLRSRVRQYFSGDSDKRFFVRFIREKTNSIEYIVAKSEADALILENELIKKFKPAYNISLKDDKRYLSLRLDLKHEWPRVEITRKIKKDGAMYLGPFSSASRLRETLNLMQKLFPLRTCPDSKLYNRSRPCIEYDIKRCSAPCVNYIDKRSYDELVQSALLFLQGENQELIQKLEVSMEKAAEEEAYEEAARYRDRLEAVRQITADHSGMVGHGQLQKANDQDAIGFARDGKRAILFMIFVRNGIFWDQRTFEFSSLDIDDDEFLLQFLDRYYSSDVYIPHEVHLSKALDVEKLGVKVKVIKPRSGEKQSFLQMAEKNAEVKLEGKLEKLKKMSEVLTKIKAKLKLRNIPQQMDCIDISHHQGEQVVASVVRFEEAIPAKNFYRKIKLKTDKVDDFAAMKEAIERRYKQESDLPDLIVIDGGKGQLSSAAEALKQIGYEGKVEIVSLAKARNIEEEKIDPLNPMNRERIFKLNRKNPILLAEDSPEELLLSYLRDEAHRFAISFHRQRKLKTYSLSILDEVEGISLRLKLKLLKHFGSVDAIAAAEDVDLLKILRPKVLDALREKLTEIA